jgi:hypothetical protein
VEAIAMSVRQTGGAPNRIEPVPRPRPHHRPLPQAPLSDPPLGISVVVERVPTPGVRDQLSRILLDMIHKPRHGS